MVLQSPNSYPSVGFTSTTQQYTTISGVDSNLLSIDIYHHNDYQTVSRPVVIYIHGGAWALGDKSVIDSKAKFFNNLGYVFISVNYRLSDKTLVLSSPISSWPANRVKHSNHINDCAKAVTWIYNHISSYGGDQNKLVLIGHSAGAQLVSLLSTNQSYLTAAGLPSGKIAGCISLDTEANSGILQQITNPVADGEFPPDALKRFYLNAFGIYPDRTVTGTVTNITTDFATTAAAQASYTTASPISNIGSSTPPFLLFHRGTSDRITRENEFSTALQSAGRTRTVVTYPGDTTYTHAEINDSIGAKNDPPIDTTTNLQKSLPPGVDNVTTQIKNWITNLVPAPEISKSPTVTGTDLTVSSSYTLNGRTYPVRGNLWVPTSSPDSSIDVVVAYHGTIETPGATIADASAYMMNVWKTGISATDKIIFSVAYPQDHISVAQNINLLTQTQLNSFYLGDNLPYAQAALLWAKNNLNTFMTSNSISKTIKDVYMFGHSQGGSLVHKLNTLVQTKGVVANAPGPIRLDETCAAGETAGASNTTCTKLFGAYGTANSTPLSSNQYFLRSVENYVTGHLAPITYTQALDDTTGYAPGVLGQVGWMTELTSIMQTNGQTYSYYTVPTGGHGAYEHNAYLQGIIRDAVDSTASQVSISFSQIAAEFGTPSGKNIGAYRVSQTVSGLTTMPLDTGIPQSGPIKFSDFYSKQLNVVVDYTSSSVVTKVNGRSDYDANNSKVVVIGGFKTRPANPAGTKVWIHTNSIIGSDQKSNTRQYCSLLTGSWDPTTTLKIDIGPTGKVVGAGGDGGSGGSVSGTTITANPGVGKTGTSAIGINATNKTSVNNRGIILCGGGGGGGSAAAWGHTHDPGYNADQYSVSGGSGGGGGAGYPFGLGGSAGSASAPYRVTAYQGNAGSNGSLSSGGKGGDGVGGGNSQGEGISVTGGGGGGGHNGLGGAIKTATGNPGNPYPQYSTITSLIGGSGTATSGGSGGRSEGVGAYAHNYFGASGAATAPDNPTTTGASGGADGYSIVVNTSSTGVTITNTGIQLGDVAYNTTPQ